MEACSNCKGSSLTRQSEGSLKVVLVVAEARFEVDIAGPLDVERCDTCQHASLDEELAKHIGQMLAGSESTDKSFGPRITIRGAPRVSIGSKPLPSVTVRVDVVVNRDGVTVREGSVTVRGPDVTVSIPARIDWPRIGGTKQPTDQPANIYVQCRDTADGAEVGIMNDEDFDLAVELEISGMYMGWNFVGKKSWRRCGLYRRERCSQGVANNVLILAIAEKFERVA